MLYEERQHIANLLDRLGDNVSDVPEELEGLVAMIADLDAEYERLAKSMKENRFQVHNGKEVDNGNK